MSNKKTFFAAAYALASITTFLMIPVMLASAYLGLHLGALRASRKKSA